MGYHGIMLKHLPNLLTLSRIAVIPLLVAAFYLEGEITYWLAASLFLYASVTDFLDGYLARRLAVQSAIGTFLDPIADKLIVTAAIVMLIHDGEATTRWDVLPALAILCREILVSGLREFLSGSKVPMPVTHLAKWKTGVQLFAIGFLLWAPAIPQYGWVENLARAALWIAAGLTVFTGYVYLRAGLRHMQETGR